MITVNPNQEPITQTNLVYETSHLSGTVWVGYVLHLPFCCLPRFCARSPGHRGVSAFSCPVPDCLVASKSLTSARGADEPDKLNT